MRIGKNINMEVDINGMVEQIVSQIEMCLRNQCLSCNNNMPNMDINSKTLIEDMVNMNVEQIRNELKYRLQQVFESISNELEQNIVKVTKNNMEIFSNNAMSADESIILKNRLM